MLEKFLGIFKGRDRQLEYTSRIEALWTALDQGDCEQVLGGASSLLAVRSGGVAGEANKLMGLALFRLNKYASAVPYFQIAAKGSRQVGDWLNLITTAALSGDVDEAEWAYTVVTNLHKETGFKQKPSLPTIQFYYACALRDIGSFDLAMSRLNELRCVYEALTVTDSTFLHIRGVPFLSSFAEVVVDVLKGLGEEINTLIWLEQFAAKLDDEGQDYLHQVMAGLAPHVVSESVIDM